MRYVRKDVLAFFSKKLRPCPFRRAAKKKPATGADAPARAIATGAAGEAGNLPSQSRLPPCQLPQGGSRVSSPPGVCRKPSLASPFGGGAPVGGGEGNPPPARTCAILLMSTSGSELPKARIDSPGTGPRTCAILLMSTSGASCPRRELPGVQPPRLESPGTGPPGPKMGK